MSKEGFKPAVSTVQVARVLNLKELPPRDAYGNFVFGDTAKDGPTLFRSAVYDRGDNEDRWLVFMGKERGFAWEKPDGEPARLLKLASPQEALKVLRNRLEGRGR